MEAIEYFYFLSGMVFGFTAAGLLFIRSNLRLRHQLEATDS